MHVHTHTYIYTHTTRAGLAAPRCGHRRAHRRPLAVASTPGAGVRAGVREHICVSITFSQCLCHHPPFFFESKATKFLTKSCYADVFVCVLKSTRKILRVGQFVCVCACAHHTQAVRDEAQPYAPQSAAPAAATPAAASAAGPKSTPAPAAAASGDPDRRGGKWRSPLARRPASSGSDSDAGAGASDSDGDDGGGGGGGGAGAVPAPDWGVWPYPLPAELWPADEEAGEGPDAAMQRCMNAQLQVRVCVCVCVCMCVRLMGACGV